MEDDAKSPKKAPCLNAETAVGTGSHILGFPGDWADRFGLEWSKLYTKKKGAILPPEAAAQAARADEEEENEDMTVEEEYAQAEQLNLFSMDQ